MTWASPLRSDEHLVPLHHEAKGDLAPRHGTAASRDHRLFQSADRPAAERRLSDNPSQRLLAGSRSPDCGDITGSPAMEEAGALLTFAADATYCSVCACMQTQHKVQMDARDNGTYVAPAFMAPPDVQTMGYGATGPQSGMYR